jgi:hypothetical protein
MDAILAKISEELGSDIKASNLDQLMKMNPDRLFEYFAKHPQFKSICKEYENALNIQVCFMIDVTGSMASYSSFKNNTIGLILDSLFEFMNKKSKKRYAFIGYRERDEEKLEPIVFKNFTETLPEIRKLISEVKLDGGGDAPEDVELAFKKFCDDIEFDQGGTRILIHIADAPCHGEDYHDYPTDEHPERSDQIPKLLRKIACNYDCAYWFVKVSDDTNKMIKRFNHLLQIEAPKSEFNRILELDLRNLKADTVKQIMLENLLATTLATALKNTKK